MKTVKILAFAGSTRTESFNKMLVKIAADGAREASAEVTLIELRDFPLPLFDEDLERERGLPTGAKELKRLFREHDGLLISAPEYNSSITGVLKNAIDWVSRTETDNEPPLVCYRGKTAALLSASPGALGGLRGLVHVRAILGNIGVLVLPAQLSVPRAHEAFNAAGALTDESKQKAARDIGRQLAELTARVAGTAQ